MATSCAGQPASCSRCRRALRKFKDTQNIAPNLFDFHLEVKDIRGKKKQQQIKKEKLKDIEILISALINSEGGIIVVHLKGLARADRCLSYFDEFVEDSVKNFVEDGSLYIDVYSRDWLSERKSCEEFRDFVCIKIETTKGVATYDYKTKVCTDFKIERPSSLNIISLIKGKEHQVKEELQPKTWPSLPHESRSVQFKRCIGTDFDLVKNYPKKLARFIWIELRLREYISCMSKVCEGGSYYLGILENKRSFPGESCTYDSIELVAEGFEIGCSQDLLIEELLKLAGTELSLLDLSGKFQDTLPKFFDIKFHSCQNRRAVLEVAITHVKGIVFYDRRGPESYRINSDGEIERIPRDEWLQRIQRTLDDAPEAVATEP